MNLPPHTLAPDRHDTTAGSGEPESNRWTLMLVVLALAFVAVFGRGIIHGWVMWDDPVYILYNPLVHDWLAHSWYERLLTPHLGYPLPLPTAIYALFWHLGAGWSARLVHALSVMLHAANAALVFVLARRWFSRKKLALMAAALWCFHPVTVESVMWATDLKEVLVVCGILLALVGWEVFVEDAHRRGLIVVAAGFALALASKPTAVVLVGLLLLRTWISDPRRFRKPPTLMPLGVVGVICIGWAVLAFEMHASLLAHGRQGFSQRSYLVTVLASLGSQLAHYVFPVNLQPYYPLQLQHFDAQALLGAVGALVVVSALIRAIVRRSRLALPLGLFVIAYLPYSNLAPLPRVTADTYLYLPSVGLAMLIALGVSWLANLLAERTRRPAGAYALLVAWVVTCVVLSTAQVDRWSSTRALWAPLLGAPQRLALPYSLIAFEDYLAGRSGDAADLLERAWPVLRHSRQLPRFAPKAFLGANRPALASDATMRVLEMYGGDAELPLQTLRFLVRHDLPLPTTVENRPLVEQMVAQWRSRSLGAREIPPSRLERYFHQRGWDVPIDDTK